jgi:hypothetical protein
MTKPTAQIPIPQAAAACTAFAAFAVSVFVGIASENPATTILGRALLAMVAGFAGGFALGLVCEWIVREEVARVEREFAGDAVGVGAGESVRNGRAGDAGAEVDLDGLTGVDVIEEEPAEVAAARGAIDDRQASARR